MGTRTSRNLSVLALLAVAAVPAACAGKSPNPPVGPSTPVEAGAAEAGPEAGTWGAMGSSGSDAGLPMANAPEAGAPEAGAAAPLGTAIVPAMTNEAMDIAIDLAVKAQAAKDAPGMVAEGQPGRQTIVENDHFNMLVTLQPNRCYTILGFSPAGQVTNLELRLLAPPLFNIEAGKSGANDKNGPVIGKGKAALCPLLPLPVSYKIDAVAKKGSGRVGIYVYARNK